MGSTFSERIKELRTSKEMSQADFAKLISTNQSTLSAYENGDRFPPYETLVIVAQQYNVSLDWLCGLSEQKNINEKPKTYSDLIKILMTLHDIDNVSLFFSLKDYGGGNFSTVPFYTLLCEIDDKHIIEFYQEWQDILSIRKKSASGEKLYSIWLKDILERYNFLLENTAQIEELPFD